MTDMPTDTSAPEIIAEVSPPQTLSRSLRQSRQQSLPLEWDFPGLAAPLPTLFVNRTHPTSSRDDERPSQQTISPNLPSDLARGNDDPIPQSGSSRRLFDTPDPFASLRSASSRTLTPVEGARRPTLSPLGDPRPPLTDPGPRGVERELDHKAEKAGEDGENEEGRRRSKRATTRMLSFEDMLAGGPDGSGGRRWGC